MKKKCCPNCAVYGVTAYLIGEQHVTPSLLSDIISDECPVSGAQEGIEQPSKPPYTFDELADIGESIKEEK